MDEVLATYLTRAIIPNTLKDGDTVDHVQRIRRMASSGRSFNLPEREFPDLVRFPDRNNSESIRAVCLVQGDRFDRAPPRSCAIRPARVTVTPTRKRVTDRISEVLPWVGTRSGSMT